ncbi:LCP family protein [Enterococcus gallinarum]|uniref:LCP family protein n=1 Tax=Enterococcus gallinarum TaxID=1353 RepID=UPI000E3F7C16|nr:LCP family protein [Enterococcus gallinarum]MBO6324738.1 transcriptional regulator [Enterococcus gallinarum]MDT2693716.1 LCP family protein [Enterococcus gallinarum]RGC45323.1 transcriptional regulator [Enterococcus gallinarum]TXT68367.1 transcriptional regulator [Enterococcus gallinarum]
MRKIILILLFVSVVLVGGITGWAVYSANKINTKVYEKLNPSDEQYDLDYDQLKQEPFNVLLLGVDTGEFGRTDSGRSDSMIVAHINLKKKEYTLMGVERNLLVDIADQGMQDKLNAAYAYGGASCSVKTVEKMLDIQIPYFVSIDMGDFQKILKEVGAVQVENEFEFSSDGFDFPKGKLTLSPEEALSWARMRYEDPRGDYGRQMRQQLLLKGVLENMAQLNQVTKWNAFIDILTDNIKTNLPITNLVLHAKKLMKEPTIIHDQVIGEELIQNGISYQTVSTEEIARVHDVLTTNKEEKQ